VDEICAAALGDEVKPAPTYTEYHPRWYRRGVSTYWWLGQWRYFKFVLREISSVFVAFYVGVTLCQIVALAGGRQAYMEFQEWLHRPLVLALNTVSLCFLLFHTATWFNAAPRALVVRAGGKRVPEPVIVAANYAAWAVVSGVCAWFVLRG
jgi:fumarate reductase subunit C